MKSKPFKMKNPSLAKAMKDGSPMQLNYGSPAKIDLSKGFKKVYNKGKELYDKIPKNIKNKVKDAVQPMPHYNLFRQAREQSSTFRDLTNKPVEKMIKVKNTIKKKLGK